MKYDPAWAVEFQKIKDFLESILNDNHEQIHHIGSTSVISLYAKPIIDIDISYIDNFELIKSSLTANNYEYEGCKGIAYRHSFKYLKDDLYEHHLYVIEEGKAPLKAHLDLKMALQSNMESRKQYSDLKLKLVDQNNQDRELYTNSKTDLIMKILLEVKTMKTIILAGGCFWGVEAYFKQLEGVVDTESGYINGEGEPTYEQVCNFSGHAEAVLIKYDDEVISLKKLLDHFFNIINPTSINKQGNDKGIQYRTGIYNYAPEQLPFIKSYLAIRQKEYVGAIAIEVVTNLVFYKAEDYHQDYLGKNRGGYCHIDLKSHKNIK